MTTTTTTTDKTKIKRVKKPLKTGYQILTEYQKRYPEKEELVTEIRQAIKETKHNFRPEFKPLEAPIFLGMRSLLLGSFLWTDSKQGFEYWEKIFNRIDD